jgi:hypothetical protein
MQSMETKKRPGCSAGKGKGITPAAQGKAAEAWGDPLQA